MTVAAAAEQAAGVEDADVGDLLGRLDDLGQRERDDPDALAQDLEFDDLAREHQSGHL